MEDFNMPDRPIVRDAPGVRDTREHRSDNSVLTLIVLAALAALLLIFGTRMFNANTDKLDINAAPPSIDSPTTSETQKP
jgi:hypothetical protein